MSEVVPFADEFMREKGYEGRKGLLNSGINRIFAG